MPRQETFLTVKNGDEVVEVLKTYDETFAREAFKNMDDSALAHLAASLDLNSQFDPEDIPHPTDESYEEFIWDVMCDSAREDWNMFSWFVVAKTSGQKTEELFISADWPTAESYIKRMGISKSVVIPGNS
jgi:hypothetical protein